MKEKYLPIGSIVTLKDATKKLMITGYFPISEQNKMYDYNACIYPEGVVTSSKTLVFNHNQIDKINYEGYKDEEYEMFLQKIKEVIDGLNQIKKVELPTMQQETVLEKPVLKEPKKEKIKKDEIDTIEL